MSDKGRPNSTEELTRLSAWQWKKCTKPNKGLYPERAGGRALSATERKNRDEVEAKWLEELRPEPEIEEDEVKVIQSASHKRDRRVPISVLPASYPPSQSLLGVQNPAVQIIGQKRSYTDVADPE